MSLAFHTEIPPPTLRRIPLLVIRFIHRIPFTVTPQTPMPSSSPIPIIGPPEHILPSCAEKIIGLTRCHGILLSTQPGPRILFRLSGTTLALPCPQAPQTRINFGFLTNQHLRSRSTTISKGFLIPPRTWYFGPALWSSAKNVAQPKQNPLAELNNPLRGPITPCDVYQCLLGARFIFFFPSIPLNLFTPSTMTLESATSLGYKVGHRRPFCGPSLVVVLAEPTSGVRFLIRPHLSNLSSRASEHETAPNTLSGYQMHIVSRKSIRLRQHVVVYGR